MVEPIDGGEDGEIVTRIWLRAVEEFGHLIAERGEVIVGDPADSVEADVGGWIGQRGAEDRRDIIASLAAKCFEAAQAHFWIGSGLGDQRLEIVTL